LKALWSAGAKPEGVVCVTVNSLADEQLLPVLLSPLTLSTHAP
jgi:hypothetical protein